MADATGDNSSSMGWFDRDDALSSAAAILFVAAFGILSARSTGEQVDALTFVLLIATTWLTFAVFLCCEETNRTVRFGVMAAGLARIAGVAAAPIYEDDWARYLWDGWRTIADGTPYGVAPAEFLERADVPAVWMTVLQTVNHPDVPTIYGPTLQGVFALAAAIGPAELLVLKLLFVIFDLIVWVLVWKLGGATAGLRYALCPLVVFEVSFNAHADIVGVALMVLAFFLLSRRGLVRSGIAFGLAIAAKPLAIALAPIFLGLRAFAALFAAIVTIGAAYAPFFLRGATEADGLAVFSQYWEFNSFGFAVLKEYVGEPHVRALSLALGCSISGALMLVWLLRPTEKTPPVDLWLLALFLFSPVVNAWYLLWIAPWAALRGSAISFAALAAVSTSYLTDGVLGIEGTGYHDHQWWVRPLEVMLFASIAFGLFLFARKRSQTS